MKWTTNPFTTINIILTISPLSYFRLLTFFNTDNGQFGLVGDWNEQGVYNQRFGFRPEFRTRKFSTQWTEDHGEAANCVPVTSFAYRKWRLNRRKVVIFLYLYSRFRVEIRRALVLMSQQSRRHIYKGRKQYRHYR